MARRKAERLMGGSCSEAGVDELRLLSMSSRLRASVMATPEWIVDVGVLALECGRSLPA